MAPPRLPKSQQGSFRPKVARQNFARALNAFRQKGEAGLRKELLRLHPPIQQQFQPPDPAQLEQPPESGDFSDTIPAPPAIS
jgi:ATP-dependent DNA ligase